MASSSKTMANCVCDTGLHFRRRSSPPSFRHGCWRDDSALYALGNCGLLFFAVECYNYFWYGASLGRPRTVRYLSCSLSTYRVCHLTPEIIHSQNTFASSHCLEPYRVASGRDDHADHSSKLFSYLTLFDPCFKLMTGLLIVDIINTK